MDPSTSRTIRRAMTGLRMPVATGSLSLRASGSSSRLAQQNRLCELGWALPARGKLLHLRDLTAQALEAEVFGFLLASVGHSRIRAEVVRRKCYPRRDEFDCSISVRHGLIHQFRIAVRLVSARGYGPFLRRPLIEPSLVRPGLKAVAAAHQDPTGGLPAERSV